MLSVQESLALTLEDVYKDHGLPANIIHVKAIDVINIGAGTEHTKIIAAMLSLLSEDANEVGGTRTPLYNKEILHNFLLYGLPATHVRQCSVYI